MKILVTGGAGFIGSAVIRYILSETSDHVINVDKLTYAGNLESLEDVISQPANTGRYTFIQADICDSEALNKIFQLNQPDAVMHLAAESHVDRSIDGPKDFMDTNIMGTFHLLQTSRSYYQDLSSERRQAFRFHHISTDEVYGSLGETGLFKETTPYQPNSPYSASKAASDHLVRAWNETFQLPTVMTNCSNNYGPFQFPEKLIPLMILNALNDKPLPVYGDGTNVRDWLYVDDHARALYAVLKSGRIGETYNVGGNCEMRNIDVVHTICDLLDELAPRDMQGSSRRDLITFVKDRPGHDQRYAIDASKIEAELGFSPQESFETGLRKTIQWYLDHAIWVERVQSGKYRQERLGLSE